jgi:hypothetical protein
MNWYTKVKLAARPRFTYDEALQIFGFTHTPTSEEIRKRYRELAQILHPDKQGGDTQKFIDLNDANQILSTTKPRSSRTDFSYKQREAPVTPPWQTDRRSSYNEVNEDLHDINWAKKTIYEYSIERGSVDRWMIYAHDGYFFRHGATFMTNKESLPYAAKVVGYWNSNGGNPHNTAAIVAMLESNPDKMLVVLLKGQNVLDKNISYDCEGSPWNDKYCKKFMEDLIHGVDVTG